MPQRDIGKSHPYAAVGNPNLHALRACAAALRHLESVPCIDHETAEGLMHLSTAVTAT
jgi:hypothetical protein